MHEEAVETEIFRIPDLLDNLRDWKIRIETYSDPRWQKISARRESELPLSSGNLSHSGSNGRRFFRNKIISGKGIGKKSSNSGGFLSC